MEIANDNRIAQILQESEHIKHYYLPYKSQYSTNATSFVPKEQ